MRVLNVMFGRGKGGLEQAFLDYNAMLKSKGHEVIALYRPPAYIENILHKQDIESYPISSWGSWDLLASFKLRSLVKKLKPDVITTHGNRALALMNRAKGTVPLVAVSHNYSIKHFTKADWGVSVTKALADTLKKEGVKNTHHIPNMLPVDKKYKGFQPWKGTPTIGAWGRFVEDKGFRYFLKALHLLKEKEIPFKAVLAGQGPQQELLESMIKDLDLENHVTFSGWIDHKDDFYDGIDIFCIPSIHEPFGIVLLEGMKYQKPIVYAASEGPSEVMTPDHDGLCVPIKDEKALAQALDKTLKDQSLCKQLVKNGYETLETKYSFESVADQLDSLLTFVVKR